MNSTTDQPGPLNSFDPLIGWKNALVITVLASFALFTVLGNLLVVLSVYKNKHLRTITNSFVVSLAVADMLVGLGVMPLGIYYNVVYDRVWNLGRWACDIWRASDVLACSASILNLCCISLERYGTIVHQPLNRRSINRRTAGKFIAAAWLCSFAVSFPCIFWWRIVENSRFRCDFTEDENYLVISACVSFYIPAIIMISVYCKIFQVARRQEKHWKSGALKLKSNRIISESNLANITTDAGYLRIHVGSRPEGKVSMSKEHKATKMIAKVIGTFLLFWFPYFTVANILWPFCGKNCVLKCKIVLPVVTWLGYINSMFNPIIYACNSKAFKAAFKRLLLCNTTSVAPPTPSPSTFRKYATSLQ